jgi:hypothetical protein
VTFEQPPRGLQAPGRRQWRDVVGSWRLRPDELEALECSSEPAGSETSALSCRDFRVRIPNHKRRDHGTIGPPAQGHQAVTAVLASGDDSTVMEEVLR